MVFRCLDWSRINGGADYYHAMTPTTLLVPTTAEIPSNTFVRLSSATISSTTPVSDRVTLTKAEGESTDDGNGLAAHFGAALPLL
jgi:hypothetical protein